MNRGLWLTELKIWYSVAQSWRRPMGMSRSDALAALNEVERAEARSLDIRVYRTTGLMLIGWGVVWMVGYSLTALAPHWANVIWGVGVTAGVLFHFVVKR